MDVTTETFERDVVERSRELPVVVDFWSGSQKSPGESADCATTPSLAMEGVSGASARAMTITCLQEPF